MWIRPLKEFMVLILLILFFVPFVILTRFILTWNVLRSCCYQSHPTYICVGIYRQLRTLEKLTIYLSSAATYFLDAYYSTRHSWLTDYCILRPNQTARRRLTSFECISLAAVVFVSMGREIIIVNVIKRRNWVHMTRFDNTHKMSQLDVVPPSPAYNHFCEGNNNAVN